MPVIFALSECSSNSPKTAFGRELRSSLEAREQVSTKTDLHCLRRGAQPELRSLQAVGSTGFYVVEAPRNSLKTKPFFESASANAAASFNDALASNHSMAAVTTEVGSPISSLS